MRVDNDAGAQDAIARLERKVDGIASDVAAMRRQMLWERLWGILKTAVIVIPIVIGFLYAYPIVKKLYDQTQGVIQQVQGVLPTK